MDVKMLRGDDPMRTWAVRYSGVASGLGAAGDEDGKLQVEVHDDGNATTWIAFRDEEVHIRRTRQAKGSEIQMSTYATQFLDELRSETPFGAAIGEADLSVLADTSVDGVACDVVKVVKAGTAIEETWFFAKSDHLPRRYVTAIPQMGETTIEITKLKANPELTMADLTIVPPPNFAVIDRGPNRVLTTGPNGAGAGKPKRIPGVALDNEAPDFELDNASGEKVRLRSLRPNVVVVSFWGSWCLPCRDANDELETLASHFEGKPVKVVSIAAKEADPANAIAAMNAGGWTFELLLDAESKIARNYKINRYPTFFVIGREGEIVYVTKGYKAGDTTFAEMTKAIEDYLNKPVEEPAAPVNEGPSAPGNRPVTTPGSQPGRTTTGGGGG
jgi:peroxiredoxin